MVVHDVPNCLLQRLLSVRGILLCFPIGHFVPRRPIELIVNAVMMSIDLNHLQIGRLDLVSSTTSNGA